MPRRAPSRTMSVEARAGGQEVGDRGEKLLIAAVPDHQPAVGVVQGEAVRHALERAVEAVQGLRPLADQHRDDQRAGRRRAPSNSWSGTTRDAKLPPGVNGRGQAS